MINRKVWLGMKISVTPTYALFKRLPRPLFLLFYYLSCQLGPNYQAWKRLLSQRVLSDYLRNGYLIVEGAYTHSVNSRFDKLEYRILDFCRLFKSKTTRAVFQMKN